MAAVEGPLQTHDAAAEGVGTGEPGPRALAVVRALQDQLPDAEVVLFGSRAAGTWHPWSDLDMAVIGVEHDRAQENEAWELARTAAQDVYTCRPDV